MHLYDLVEYILQLKATRPRRKDRFQITHTCTNGLFALPDVAPFDASSSSEQGALLAQPYAVLRSGWLLIVLPPVCGEPTE